MATILKRVIHDTIARVVMASPYLRRAVWRSARSLYCLARGEQRVDDMRVDGELDLQRKVIEANHKAARFVAFDVGANQGDWTLALIDVFQTQEGSLSRLMAHAFEPVPTTRDRLLARLVGVDETTVRVLATAASDKAGVLEMIVMSDTGGTNSLVFDDAMAAQALGFVTTPVTTLDIYCHDAGVDRIHILKCDTEGHDLAVIRGAAGLLQAGRIDVFQFEYNHRWISARAYLKDVFDLIDDLPYQLGRVTPSTVQLFETWHPELERYFQSNYVLVHERALPWLKITRGAFDASNSYA